jgi:hypothetical protein
LPSTETGHKIEYPSLTKFARVQNSAKSVDVDDENAEYDLAAGVLHAWFNLNRSSLVEDRKHEVSGQLTTSRNHAVAVQELTLLGQQKAQSPGKEDRDDGKGNHTSRRICACII